MSQTRLYLLKELILSECELDVPLASYLSLFTTFDHIMPISVIIICDRILIFSVEVDNLDSIDEMVNEYI